MGFANSSVSFTRFRILDPVTDELVLDIPQKLRQFSFSDIEDLPEMQAHGWVCYEDMLDTQWETAHPVKGQYAVFSLRLDTRRIPPSVIKKHVALAMKEEKARMADRNQKFIARERKNELKEQVLLKLRQRFLPVPAEFNVIWDLQGNEVWFASIQTKMIDLFMESFLSSFGLHLEQLTPYNLAASMLDEDSLTSLDKLTATKFIHSGESHD